MKKQYLFILVWLSCALAFFHAGHTAVIDRPIRSTGPEGYSVSALAFPHTEIEVSVQVAGVSQANQGSKKILGERGLPIKQPLDYCLYFSSCGNALSFFHSKSYLSHIYPSHNFW